MRLYFIAEILLLLIAILNIFYSYQTSSPECLDRFSMNISIISTLGTLVLLIFQNKIKTEVK